MREKSRVKFGTLFCTYAVRRILQGGWRDMPIVQCVAGWVWLPPERWALVHFRTLVTIRRV